LITDIVTNWGLKIDRASDDIGQLGRDDPATDEWATTSAALRIGAIAPCFGPR